MTFVSMILRKAKPYAGSDAVMRRNSCRGGRVSVFTQVDIRDVERERERGQVLVRWVAATQLDIRHEGRGDTDRPREFPEGHVLRFANLTDVLA